MVNWPLSKDIKSISAFMLWISFLSLTHRANISLNLFNISAMLITCLNIQYTQKSHLCLIFWQRPVCWNIQHKWRGVFDIISCILFPLIDRLHQDEDYVDIFVHAGYLCVCCDHSLIGPWCRIFFVRIWWSACDAHVGEQARRESYISRPWIDWKIIHPAPDEGFEPQPGK